MIYQSNVLPNTHDDEKKTVIDNSINSHTYYRKIQGFSIYSENNFKIYERE